MRSACSLTLLALGACDQLYGLETTRVTDAAFFDAPGDAASACPAVGVRPQFSTMFEQVPAGNCDFVSISESANLMLTSCKDQVLRGTISEGPIGGPLTPSLGLQNTADTFYDQPRLSPEGDLAIAFEYMPQLQTRRFRTFHREGTTWVADGTIDPGYPIADVSTPMRGPEHRLLAFANGAFHELAVDTVGTWHEVGVHPLVGLGLAFVVESGPQLSADGLRLLLQGSVQGSSDGGLLYVDRAAIGDVFTGATPLDPIRYVNSGYLTEACDRLYFGALGTMFFARRE